MSKRMFSAKRIIKGMEEVLSYVRGEAVPARVTTYLVPARPLKKRASKRKTARKN